jgi:SAM-dependent methyltransferase
MGAVSRYTGIDNLEVMSVAEKYQHYLARAVMRALDPPSQSPFILDFGAGFGTMASELREHGYCVTCLEPDATLRAALASEGFACSDNLAELRGEHGFDVVYSMNVLEHISDDIGALRSLFNVLRAGGRLVLYVPAFPVLFTAMDEKVGHLRRYRRSGLVGSVTAAGFRVDACHYVDSLGYLAALVYKVAGNRNGDLNERAVAMYDRYAFPVSTAIDHVARRWFGKNLLLYAERQ